MSSPPFVPITIRCDGVTHVVVHGETSRFGRHPDDNEIVIGSATRGGEEDTLVSRRAGVVSHLGAQLAIRNDATFEQIEVVSHHRAGRVRHLAPGDELRVALGPLTIAVAGRVRRYTLVIEIDGPSTQAHDNSSSDAMIGDATGAPTEGPLALTDDRRLDLAALCLPLLTGRGRDTQPASYAEGARHRGITRKALEKRIEHLIADLRNRGLLPGLEPGTNVKDSLCRFAVRSATVTLADVERLRDG